MGGARECRKADFKIVEIRLRSECHMSRSDAGAQPIGSSFGLFSRDSAGITGDYPALNAEVIDKCGELAIGIYCDMKCFMDQKIVSRSLADDLEIVDISLLETDLAVECPLCLPG